jgi:hypothetical protein
MTPKNVTGIEKLVKKIFIYLNSYQVTNLSGLVYALIHVHSPLVSEVARYFPYTKNYRHSRKRVERFLRNSSCLLGLCKMQYLKWAASLIPKRKQESIIIDYTFLGRYMILWAGIPFKGRCIPIHFAVMRNPHLTKERQHDRMIHLEYDFLRFMRIHLPWDRRWIIIGDRGFGNKRNMHLCKSIGFDYIFRVKGDTRVTTKGGKQYKNRLIKNLPKAKWRRNVWFHGVITNLLALTENTDDPWYLVSSLNNPKTIQRRYEQRMWVEEMFRDMKTHTELKKALLRSLNATKRLAFCLQLSFIIVFFVGIQAKKSKIVQRRVLGLTEASFVFIALEVLRHLFQKFCVFLKKVIRSLRLGRAVLDTS